MCYERDMAPGDVFETVNGNRYLVLTYGVHVYVGNRELSRIPSEAQVEVQPYGCCKKVGHVTWEPTEEPVA